MPLRIAPGRVPSARTVIAVAALVTGPLAVAAVAGGPSQPGVPQPSAAALSAVPVATSTSAAGAGPAAAASVAAATALQQCRAAYLYPVGRGWGMPVPAVWQSRSTTCNLRYGDAPYRGSDRQGDPDSAIRTLQRNLNYCYGSHLTVDGVYGSNTRAVVQEVQRRLRIAADGIYGPQTRSAMNWRLYHGSLNIWSKGCYSPL